MPVTGNVRVLPGVGVKATLHCFFGSLLLATAVTAAEPRREIAVVGPIVSATCGSKTIVVLGITFEVRASREFTELCSLGSGTKDKYISIRGNEIGDGQAIASRWSLLVSDSYVAG